jgi:predicted metal-dependent phosphoesterase TrpH
VHSTVSDGLHSPAEVVRMARASGVDLIALTDHDAVEGIDEAMAAGARWGVAVLPGVEISAYAGEVEVHILGYMIRHRDARLRDMLRHYRTARVRRAREMLARLAALGMPLSWERVQALAGRGSTGRPHVARALLEEGYVSSVAEAFARYLRPGMPAYVPRDKASPAEVMAAIHAAGGLAVLAHPWAVTDEVARLAAQGLDGLEVFYAGYATNVTAYLRALATEQGLICTGGSDFHGLRLMPGNPLGGVAVPLACLRALYQSHRQRGRPR